MQLSDPSTTSAAAAATLRQVNREKLLSHSSDIFNQRKPTVKPLQPIINSPQLHRQQETTPHRRRRIKFAHHPLPLASPKPAIKLKEKLDLDLLFAFKGERSAVNEATIVRFSLCSR